MQSPGLPFPFIVFASLLRKIQVAIGLDHVRTPGGMVTDNSQLVLRADRMLFSRAGDLLVDNSSLPRLLHATARQAGCFTNRN